MPEASGQSSPERKQHQWVVGRYRNCAEYAAAEVFAAIAGLGVALPVVWALAAGEGARGPLAAGRDWLARNNATIGAAVLLVIGAMLVGSGIEGL